VRTRVELANAIFEYLEIFHNRQPRHSALGWLTPLQFETKTPITWPKKPSSPTPRHPGHTRASIDPGAVQQSATTSATAASVTQTAQRTDDIAASLTGVAEAAAVTTDAVAAAREARTRLGDVNRELQALVARFRR
jgi:hypothetical protein